MPERERLSGLGEAIKYGLLFDPRLWEFIRARRGALLAGEETPTIKVIRRGAAWKLKVVAQDERETRGRRELLNFGHTLGHALEAAAGFSALRHGEAVIWGMRAAARLSEKYAGLPARAAGEIDVFLSGLPVPLPRGLRPSSILEAARRDKKARKGRLRFVLLKDIARPFVRDGISDGDILRAIGGLL